MKNTIAKIIIILLVLSFIYFLSGIVKAETCIKWQKVCNTGIVDELKCGVWGSEYEGKCCRGEWEGWKLITGQWLDSDVCLEYAPESPATPVVEPYKPQNMGGGSCSAECRHEWVENKGWLKADISAKLVSLEAQINTFQKAVKDYLSKPLKVETILIIEK